MGYSRRPYTDAAFSDEMRQAVVEHSRNEVEGALWNDFAQTIHYQQGDFSKAADYARLAERLNETELNGAVWANQFDNVANRRAHYETTGPEIWRQTEGRVDGFICAVGTGGTLAGVGMALQPKGVKIALADPEGSAIASIYRTGEAKAEGNSITLVGAILIAAFFEAGGALIAGGDVVGTIKNGIIDPDLVGDRDTFIWLMIAALLAAAVWLNFATAIGAPVSTTHSIVGGVLGAGIAAAGWRIADWTVVGQIAASWVISPVLGGLIAAGFLYVIKRTITYKRDVLTAANRMVPILVAIMAWAFSAYLMVKGVKKIVAVSFPVALLIGLGVALGVYLYLRPLIARKTEGLENHKSSVNDLFTIPLVFAAALLSFAHGANDVANAVGPLAGINEAIAGGAVITNAAIQLWVMAVGAVGISLGLALYGPKLIRTVGSEITELDKMRAFCIALSAAITVIVASQLGLPVSSTHIAVGGVFGVGFLREYIKSSYARTLEQIREHHADHDPGPTGLLGGDTKYFINPTGRFVTGGPHGDCGLTGRKIIVDTYGGAARHGGGASPARIPPRSTAPLPMPVATSPKTSLPAVLPSAVR